MRLDSIVSVGRDSDVWRLSFPHFDAYLEPFLSVASPYHSMKHQKLSTASDCSPFRSFSLISIFSFISLPFSCHAIVSYTNYLISSAPKSFESVYERKLAYYDGMESDGFGRAVDIYKNYMIVGSCFDDHQGYQSGSAHIFQLTNTKRGWEYDSQLFVNETQESDFFGWDVALAPGIAAVGAWQHDDNGYENNGAVYIFEHLSQRRHGHHSMIWSMTTKLIGVNDHQHFGISLSFSKDGAYLLIGASGDSGDDNNGVGTVGTVYVATYSTWTGAWVIQTSIQSADVGASDYYGISVATHNHVAVIGAYGQNSSSGRPGDGSGGAVYIYSNQNTDYSHWYFEAQLVASDSQQDDYFGRSVAIYDRTVVVGADGADDCGVSSGAAYIFRSYSGNIWTQIQKLLPPDDSSYELFGGSVAIYGNILVIGADGDSQNDVRTGTAWYYKRSEYWYGDDAMTDDTAGDGDDANDDYGEGGSHYEYWSREYELYASDRSSRDLYGSDVAIYETNILIGAEVGDGYEYNAGACYVYTLPPHNIQTLMSSENETNALIVVGMAIGIPLVAIFFLLIAKRYQLLDRVKEFRESSFTPPQVGPLPSPLSLSFPISSLAVSCHPR
jgi:hypothetical protein